MTRKRLPLLVTYLTRAVACAVATVLIVSLAPWAAADVTERADVSATDPQYDSEAGLASGTGGDTDGSADLVAGEVSSSSTALSAIVYQQDDPQLTYGGTWATASSGSSLAGSVAQADSSGAGVAVVFKGTSLAWIATTGPEYGKARVTLDGGTPFYVDLYSRATVYRHTVYSTGQLVDGEHTLTIQCSGVRNAYSAGSRINLDALEVMGSLATAPAPPPSLALCQQNDTRLAYSGAWGTAVQRGASGRTFKHANTRGATLTIKFSGTCLDLIGKKAPQYGKARISLDGVESGYADFYDAHWSHQELVYTTGSIANGEHTLTLEWTGVKNEASTGYLVNIDAMVVRGTLLQQTPPTTYQQSAEPAVYAGAWTEVVDASADSGSFYYADSPEASLLVEFDGTSFELFAKTSSIYGIALLSLDGAEPVLVDMYSASTLYRQSVYSTGPLKAGPHKVSIKWSGSKNAASTGCAMNVDAFRTAGSLRAISVSSLPGDRHPFSLDCQGKTRVTYALSGAPTGVSAAPVGDDLCVTIAGASGPSLPLTAETAEVHSVSTSVSAGSTTTMSLDLARYQRYRVMSLPASQWCPARIVVDVYDRNDGPAGDGPPLVYLDPGHGGSAPGAMGVVSKAAEKNLVLTVGRLAANYLSAKGVKVALTRNADTYLTLQQRCDLANTARANVFVSVHCNSFFDQTAAGTETFYQEKTPEYTVAAKALAVALQNRVHTALGLSDRGARTYYSGTLGVLNGTVMPAALVELGFISNPAEDALLTSAAGQDKSARAIADAVCDYLRWSTAVYSSE